MSQKTDLNISPYFDDFDINKNFYRVLFKPGFPVQSRELITLQSILQNQIESFGSHFFKEGSLVVPGNTTYDSEYYAVKINDLHLGLDVGIYLKELIGKKIKGQNSQIIAIVKDVLTKVQSEVQTYTLYVKYLNSDVNYEINQFNDGETLISLDTFKYGNTTINSGQTIASLINDRATSIGSAVHLSKGVYFIRGTFVSVDESTLILDQYTNTPSYRVGLNVQETIEFASTQNSDLFDNARGFENYAAPGADRLKIFASLSKKALNDFDDRNFIEILRVSNGVIKKLQDNNTYSLIKEYIAKRTYDESGDYAISPFSVEVKNSLNDRISSNGIYFDNQKTDQNNVPSTNLLSVSISPGKAYVKGFDVEKSETTILDVEKPRDTTSVSSSSVPFEMGNLLRVNNVSGSPVIGIDNNYTISLYSQRKNSTIAGTGNEIGKARVYSFSLNNNSYVDNTTKWDLYLFDVQTYTELTLNQALSSVSCPASSFIKGLSSGASGYAVSSPTNDVVTLIQTSGSFNPNEQISINGSTEYSRTIKSIRAYNVNDIKSVYQDSTAIGLSTDFSADAFLTRKTLPNFNATDVLTINSSGIATCAGKSFIGVASDTIIRYQKTGFTTETFNRVVGISTNGLSITLAGINTVSGICDGGLPTTTTSVTFSAGVPSIQNEENAFLYAKLNNKNISTVNFVGSELKVSRQTTGKSTNAVGTLSLSLADVGITSAYFETFDVERYSVFYPSGAVEQLTSDKFSLDGSGTSVTLSGLTPSQSNVIVNSTVRKNSIRNKQKIYLRSEKLEVDKTSIGLSTSLSGLSTNSYYGLRVQDEEISLNVPDVANVIAIYESVNSSSPILDALNFSTGLNLNTNSIVGEKIVGQTSGAVGQLVTRNTSTKIEFVYLNSNKFVTGETVSFTESKILAPIQSIDVGVYVNRTQEYSLDKGHREQYYDYSRIVRKNPLVAPSRKLLIIFNCYTVPTSDSGDVYTAASYDAERYEKDIPILGNNIRASDVLDFRPRVSTFTSTSSSPFDFSSRSFAAAGINPTLVLTPNESSTIGYSYYLPRIDKIVLNKSGSFVLIKGTSASTPKEPTSIEDSMEIAVLNLPAYLYDPSDVKVTLTNNKRYTMKDIGSIEKRLENVEIASSLSLLELDTKTLQILDSDGINKFKSGFFVDNFKTNNFIDIENLNSKCVINTNTEELISDISSYSLKSEIGVNGSINIDSADFSADLLLSDNNIKKTGDIVTLNYTETSAGIGQTYATEQQNINPAGVTNYNGYVKLTPSSDTWVRSVLSDDRVVVRNQGEWNNSFISELLLSTKPSDKYKSKNIQFYATGLQPNTQYYSFFDGNSNVDVIPKLLQVTMESGSASFQTGEIVDAYQNGVKIASFRLSTPTHKKGIYNATSPEVTYSQNPYNTAQTIAASYSASSTLLNIDTYSLSDDASGRFFGYVPQGAILIGKISGAQATVSTQSLITDNLGDLIGCFFIRNPLQTPAPTNTFGVGTKTFKLSSSSTNSSSTSISYSQNTFYATGIVNSQTNTTITSLRRPSPAQSLNAQRTDPLSQTFRTDNDGMFLTSVDLYFAQKDTTEKVFVEIRETDIGGTPKTNLIQDYARTEILPAGITTSSTGQSTTNVKFPSPIYLEPNKQYAVCVTCPSSSNYKLWIAKTNEATVSTQTLPNASQVIYSNNYIGGNLYKPQNGGIWNSSTSEDLTFKLYKANFTSTTGTVYFNNPNISVGSTTYVDDLNIPQLVSNPIKVLPRKLTVGITTSSTTVVGTVLVPGRKVAEGDSTGFIEKVGGNIVGITTTSVGIGYSNGTFTNVPLYNITGYGINAIATVTIANNQVSSVSIANSGCGYAVGDVLGITTSSVVKGSGAKITVSSLSNIDTLYLSNVQGEEFTLNLPISYYNGTTKVAMASTVVTRSSYVPDYRYSGNVFEVTQYNHGMQSNDNTVVISGVSPDTTAHAITANIVSNTTAISIASTANFTTFEGQVVSGSNPGYVIINNEIISYTVGTNSLTILQRGKFGSPIRTHSIGDLIYKYELNGVSLARINRQHNLPSNQTLKSYREIDTYHLQFDRSYLVNRSNGSTQLSFNDEKIVGGSNVKASQNIQYSSIIPYFNVLIPENTLTSSLLRTISGTSVNGGEASYLDQGYQSVNLNQINYFNTPRLIPSRINETNRLSSSTFPNQKSLSLGITLSTSNSNVSPIIDVSEAATFVFNRNRINRPIQNYASDSRSNSLTGDPHSSVYISKKVNLKQPATSLKVLVTAYRHSSSDFRVLYQLFKSDSSEINQSYQLFPGYSNLTDQNGDGFGETVIDVSLNNGLPDSFVRASNDNEFLEYQFTANNLDQFNGFVIKIVMNGTNEAYAPRFKDLRAIALA